MKIIIWLLLFIVFALLLAGFALELMDLYPLWKKRCYGIGTLVLFFVWMPVFLLWRFNKTRLLDGLDQNKNDKE